MSALLGGTAIDAEAVLRVETAIAKAELPEEDLRDPESQYHPMKADEITSLAPTFPWQTFWSEAGFAGLQSVNVAQPDYLAALEALFKSAPLEDLKSYMRWQLLQDRSSGLDQPFITEDFRFWSTFTGQAVEQSRDFTCYNRTLSAFAEAITLPYVARSGGEAATKATRAMFRTRAERLRQATGKGDLARRRDAERGPRQARRGRGQGRSPRQGP